MAKTDVKIDQTEDDILAASEQVKSNPLWTLGQWDQFPQWKCAFCQFDTLDGEKAMQAHYLAEHAPPAPVVAPPIILVSDRYGNPVERSN